MADLLSPEERAALQEPSAAVPDDRRLVAPALFPSVGQLDPERTAALAGALRRWLDPLTLDLSRQLRLPCAAHPPSAQTLGGSRDASGDEETFWAAAEACPGAYLRVALPRIFAAAVCERVFGAPFELRDDRRLAPSELMLLQDLVRRWLALFDHAWPELVIVPCPAPDPEEAPDAAAWGWLRFTSSLTCGEVEGEISVTLAPFTTRVLLGEASGSVSGLCSPERLVAHVGDVPVELRAVLGQADFTHRA